MQRRSNLIMDRSAFPLGQAPVYFYEIDVEDRIVAASDSWDEFALENEGAHLVFANVKGDLIWDHSCVVAIST